MGSLFMEELPSATNLPSKVDTAKYNKIPGIIETLNNAKLEAETQLKNLKRLNKIKMNNSNFAINNSNIRKLNKLVKKLQGHIDKLDKVTNNYLINKAKKLINESGALKRKTMKHIKRLQSKQSHAQKKSQKNKSQKKRKKSKKVKTKRRRSKRR
tara:strand:- start:136 stop:600 length:465 start_codon:yes stop_codon:yes gene_type:complete